MDPDPQARAKLLVLWVIWAADLVALVILYLVLGRSPLPPPNRSDLVVNLVGFVPLFVSIIIRWLVLPRIAGAGRVLGMFVAGLALAEACGILGLFLGGPYRDALWLLGVLGVAQYVPLFANRLGETKRTEFTPNN